MEKPENKSEETTSIGSMMVVGVSIGAIITIGFLSAISGFWNNKGRRNR